MTRTALVAALVEVNPDLATARHALDAARASPDLATALPDPMLTVAVAPASAIVADVPFGQRIELRQGMPFPGTLRPRARAAEARADALDQDLDALQRRLALRALTLYDDLAYYAAALDQLDKHARLLEALKASAEAGYAAGRASAQDPIHAEVELAHVEHQAVVFAARQRTAVAELNALLRRPQGTALVVHPIEATPPAIEPATDRPEVLATAERERAAEQHLLATRRATRPELSISGTYSSMWRTPAHQWMVALGAEVPVQLRARRAAIDEAAALQAAARAERGATEVRLEAALEQARTRYEEALHVATLFDERLVPAARARTEVARAAFETGAEDFSTVIDAERGLRDAQLMAIRADADAWTRSAELRLASGLLPLDLSPETTP